MFIVKLIQFVRIVSNQTVGENMSVVKPRKKMTYEQLEDHVISWAVDQLAMIREAMHDLEYDDTFTDDRKRSICYTYVEPLDCLLNLLIPLRHDQECLIEWASMFMREYDQSDEEYAPGVN